MAPKPALFVEIALQGGMCFQASNEDGVTVNLDAAPQYGGSGRGFSPMEMLLIGLGGCTGMDVISILRKKRQEVSAYSVAVRGVRTDEHPQIFIEISINHILRGNDLSEEAVRRAIELSESKYCPAFAMLRHAANISSTYEILAAAPVD